MPPDLTLFERVLHRFHLLPTPIMDAFSAMVFGRVLPIAVRRGVFDHLEQTPKTATELASATHLSVTGTELLLQALDVAGYLQLRRGRYSSTAEARKWLSKTSPYYLGHLLQYFETLNERWSYLEHSLERGMPPRRYYEGFSDTDWRIYVYGMRDLARLLLDDVIREIRLPESPCSLVDLGGSHGLYSMTCCQRHTHLSASIIDFPQALNWTKRMVEEEMIQERITLIGADLINCELPQSQDAVLMFNVVHGFSDQENRSLVGRAMNALKPGGRLYILDQLRENTRRSKLARFMPLMVGLNLLNEVGGNTYSFDQVRHWCREAARIRRIRLRFPGVAMVEATR